MTTSATLPAVRRALIVHAHPEPASFSTAQARAVAGELLGRGVDVDYLDLYAEGFDPVLRREQFADVPEGEPFKPQKEQVRALGAGTLGDPVEQHLRALLDADLLVLSFPLWWFSVPAVLKGWIDRVFVMGAAFGGDRGTFAEGGLAGKRAQLLVTTGGSPEAFAPGALDGYGSLDEFLFHLHRGVLEFTGFTVLPPVVTHAPVRLDDAGRDAALSSARAGVAASLDA
ncbi:NAD(P)H-dependent oxidoreductase [Kineococcus sp. NPDC059986]|uniref:NAD(P)H-dependent oxidoreductase n=1 Tax=Kineococcus sp. NPDC059986 TaxID=3155538 RepID=UPI00344DCE8E